MFDGKQGQDPSLEIERCQPNCFLAVSSISQDIPAFELRPSLADSSWQRLSMRDHTPPLDTESSVDDIFGWARRD